MITAFFHVLFRIPAWLKTGGIPNGLRMHLPLHIMHGAPKRNSFVVWPLVASMFSIQFLTIHSNFFILDLLSNIPSDVAWNDLMVLTAYWSTPMVFWTVLNRNITNILIYSFFSFFFFFSLCKFILYICVEPSKFFAGKLLKRLWLHFRVVHEHHL